jgi:hypothetical protein
MTEIDDLLALVMRLHRYGVARDRATEREPRTITVTDDEALLLLSVMGTFDHPLMQAAMLEIEREQGQ